MGGEDEDLEYFEEFKDLYLVFYILGCLIWGRKYSSLVVIVGLLIFKFGEWDWILIWCFWVGFGFGFGEGWIFKWRDISGWSRVNKIGVEVSFNIFSVFFFEEEERCMDDDEFFFWIFSDAIYKF